MNIIKEKLKLLPAAPGVYIMLDRFGNVIYVGKARVLKNRVRQYFHASLKQDKVERMVKNIADFNYIITESERDALALENNLIKKYKPKYNILLKDDKTYPYIRVNLHEEYPSFSVTRKVRKDGAKYYGPYMGGVNYKEILEVLQITFKIRLCYTSIGEKSKRECLNHHIGRCLAPCAHKCTKEDYAESVKRAVNFLEGDYKEAQTLIREKMLSAASSENFELALDYRNKLEMLSKIDARRITSLSGFIDADIIAYTTNNIYSAVNVLITRKGIMQGGTSYALEDALPSDAEALSQFIIQYYTDRIPPAEIITEESLGEEKYLLEDFFKEKFGRSIKIIFAKQGVKAQLLSMAHVNAREYLDKSIDKIKHKEDMTINACFRLKELLGLSKYPKRMECYDISNISGVDKVGSMVVFIDGERDRNSYRRFRIKTVEGADDFASLKELLRRRLAKLGTDEEYNFQKPDLIIIDGGKGQLSSVEEIFNEMGIADIDLISLAKREEEIFMPCREESIKLERRDYALKMLQRIRDEAHRFAITYFRKLHSKRNLESVLSEIPGIGKKKRLALLNKFGTIDKIMDASEETLASTEGIGPRLAAAVKNYFEDKL